jgi:hypothetical protein
MPYFETAKINSIYKKTGYCLDEYLGSFLKKMAKQMICAANSGKKNRFTKIQSKQKPVKNVGFL